MKRVIIIIEDRKVAVTGNEVWMTAGEIAGLFGVTAAADGIPPRTRTAISSLPSCSPAWWRRQPLLFIAELCRRNKKKD